MKTYVILSSLTIFQSLLKSIKERSRIEGYNKISDILGGFLAFISIIIPLLAVKGSLSTKQLLIKACIIGISAYIGNLLASSLFNKFKRDKTYKFKIRFFTQDNCVKSYKLLKDKDIAVHISKDKKGLSIFSDNRDESSIVLSTIKGKYKNYHIEELIDNERYEDE